MIVRYRPGSWHGRPRSFSVAAEAHAAADRARRKRRSRTVGSGVLRLLRYELEPIRHSAERGKRGCSHLSHQTAAMHLQGGFGDADIAGNLFAEPTPRDLKHDLA